MSAVLATPVHDEGHHHRELDLVRLTPTTWRERRGAGASVGIHPGLLPLFRATSAAWSLISGFGERRNDRDASGELRIGARVIERDYKRCSECGGTSACPVVIR